MKVAVLITGQMRDGGLLLEHNFNFFIKDINPDIYIHSYFSENQDELLNFYKPKDFFLENQDEVNINPHSAKMYVNKTSETNVENCFHMWRKRKLGFSLIKENYDKVFVTRFDCYGLSSIVNVLFMDGLCIPVNGDFRGGLFDICALGSKEDISYYCSLYDMIDTYYKDRVMFHPETLLRHHIEKNQTIQLRRFDNTIMLRNRQINILI